MGITTVPGGALCATLSLLVMAAAEAAPPPDVERGALVDLFEATRGTAWVNNGGWGSASDPCTWFGVGCAGGHHVTNLSLPLNGLDGGVPPSLGNLTQLEYLYVRARVPLCSCVAWVDGAPAHNTRGLSFPGPPQDDGAIQKT